MSFGTNRRSSASVVQVHVESQIGLQLSHSRIGVCGSEDGRIGVISVRYERLLSSFGQTGLALDCSTGIIELPAMLQRTTPGRHEGAFAWRAGALGILPLSSA